MEPRRAAPRRIICPHACRLSDLRLIGFTIAVALQRVADAFIKRIKMLLTPIIFGTVVLGTKRIGSVNEVRRIGVPGLIVSTLTLVIGLVS